MKILCISSKFPFGIARPKPDIIHEFQSIKNLLGLLCENKRSYKCHGNWKHIHRAHTS